MTNRGRAREKQPRPAVALLLETSSEPALSRSQARRRRRAHRASGRAPVFRRASPLDRAEGSESYARHAVDGSTCRAWRFDVDRDVGAFAVSATGN